MKLSANVELPWQQNKANDMAHITFLTIASIIDNFKYVERITDFAERITPTASNKNSSSSRLCVRQIHDSFPVLWFNSGHDFDMS